MRSLRNLAALALMTYTFGASAQKQVVTTDNPVVVHGMTYMGLYGSTISYALNAVVTSGGSTYVSLVAGNVGNTPESSTGDWRALAPAVNGVVNEEFYSGASVPARVSIAASECGANPCTIVIPPSAPAGSNTGGGWGTPNNVIVQDLRVQNGSGVYGNALPYEKAGVYYEQSLGANSAFENQFDAGYNLVSASLMVTGGTNGGTSCPGVSNCNYGNALASFFSVNRAIGSSRSVWGTNQNVGYFQSDSVGSGSTAIGEEIDINNEDTVNDTGLFGIGEEIIASGNAEVGIGLRINAQPNVAGATRGFLVGEAINNYSTFGLKLSTSTARSADLYIVPPADDSNASVIGRNSGDTANAWAIKDDGSAEFKALGVSSIAGSRSLTVTLGDAAVVGVNASMGGCDSICDSIGGVYHVVAGTSTGGQGVALNIRIPAGIYKNNPRCTVSAISTSSNTPLLVGCYTSPGDTGFLLRIFTAALVTGNNYAINYALSGN